MPRSRFIFLLAILAIQSILAATAAAQQATVTQNLTLVVERVTRVAVSGNPKPLAITELDERSGTAAVSDNSTTYSLFTNVHNTRITASIDRPVPDGTKLAIRLDSALGTSQGMVDLSDAVQAVDVVTAIERGTELNRPITYLFSADASIARAFEEETRTVTLTIVE